MSKLKESDDFAFCPRLYSTDGRWFISQSDIDQILEENGRGLIGEVTPDYLCLFNPKMH